jgi:hypothetical protein
MRIPQHPTLIARRRDARLKDLAPRRPPLAASLVQIARRCGHPACRCAHGEKHVSWYVTLKEGGKTRTVYVPTDLTEEVRAWVQEHRRLKKLLAEITQLNLALLQGHVTQRRRKAGRA